ncbi:MAG: queuosine precursor transporter [Bacteroidetes bacterium]|nr:queuosine precursor transporter [Bacteroidota bacterium]
MFLKTKREVLFTVMAGIFITCAIVAELISCKFINIGLFDIIAGILPWPIVFLTSDIMNEFFGKQAVKKLSYITAGMIVLMFVITNAAIAIPATEHSPVNDVMFKKVFGNASSVAIGSIVAFLISQIVDIWSFWFMHKLTGGKMIWLRATGSTVISQLVDSFTVLFVGFFLLQRSMTFEQVMEYTAKGYTTKLVLAIVLTPMIYLGHFLIKRYLGDEASDKQEHDAAVESLEKP